MIVIPRIIDENEIIVRCTLHPFHYSRSKKKVKPEAFTPPPHRNDVSTLRLSYTNPDFCKKQGKSIIFGENKYLGLTIFVASIITAISEKLENPDQIHVSLVASPLDTHGQIVNNQDVFTTDEGLPMHADIIYGYTPEKGVPLPIYVKKFAKELSNNSIVFVDPLPDEENWLGDELVYT